jgi:hypothetical protein
MVMLEAISAIGKDRVIPKPFFYPGHSVLINFHKALVFFFSVAPAPIFIPVTFLYKRIQITYLAHSSKPFSLLFEYSLHIV